MNELKWNFDIISSALPILFLTFSSLFLCQPLSAQEGVEFRASVAGNIGYAPIITQGNRENSGIISGVYGELEYGNAIGRLQYTSPLLSTFNEDNNLKGGNGYHGSLGYRLDVSDQLFVAIMASGGATVINYSNGFDDFTNVSPQVGAVIAPAYRFTDHLSIQANLRYYKGFKAGDRGQASDLADLSFAVRFTL